MERWLLDDFTVVLCCADGDILNDKTSNMSAESSAESMYTCHVCLKLFSSDIHYCQHKSFHLCHPVLFGCYKLQNFRVNVVSKKFDFFRCDRKFFTVSARARHQKQHLFFTYTSGVVCQSYAKLTKKPYVDRDAHFSCKECGKVFRYRPCLLVHQRCHEFVTNEQKVLLIYCYYTLWVNVSSGTGSLGLSRTNPTEP